jgi:hypothetical protein
MEPTVNNDEETTVTVELNESTILAIMLVLSYERRSFIDADDAVKAFHEAAKFFQEKGFKPEAFANEG